MGAIKVWLFHTHRKLQLERKLLKRHSLPTHLAYLILPLIQKSLRGFISFNSSLQPQYPEIHLHCESHTLQTQLLLVIIKKNCSTKTIFVFIEKILKLKYTIRMRKTWYTQERNNSTSLNESEMINNVSQNP